MFCLIFVFQSVVLADAGHFGCEATNKFGSISANGTLAVRRRFTSII